MIGHSVEKHSHCKPPTSLDNIQNLCHQPDVINEIRFHLTNYTFERFALSYLLYPWGSILPIYWLLSYQLCIQCQDLIIPNVLMKKLALCIVLQLVFHYCYLISCLYSYYLLSYLPAGISYCSFYSKA
jgi:hypothetical protein